LNRRKKQRKYSKSKRFVGGGKKSTTSKRVSRVSSVSKVQGPQPLPPNEDYKILKGLYGKIALLNSGPIGYLIGGNLKPPDTRQSGDSSIYSRACRYTYLNGSPSLVFGGGMSGYDTMHGSAFSNAKKSQNYIEVANAKNKFVKKKIKMDPQDSSITNGVYYFLEHDPDIKFEHEGKYDIKGADIYISVPLFNSAKPTDPQPSIGITQPSIDII